MIKMIMVAAVGLTPLLAGAALAQSEGQCNQVRAAVAQAVWLQGGESAC